MLGLNYESMFSISMVHHACTIEFTLAGFVVESCQEKSSGLLDCSSTQMMRVLIWKTLNTPVFTGGFP